MDTFKDIWEKDVIQKVLFWGVIKNLHKTKLSFIESMKRKIILDI